MEKNVYTKEDRLQIPAIFIPGFRSSIAIQNGVERNLLFRTWGGLGDQICAEPTLRYALKSFKDCKISLESENPEFFQHLQFDKVYNLKKGERADHDKYLVFETITPPNDSNLVWQFFSHMLTNCVDFPSMCALRLQLPVSDKEVQLSDIGYRPQFKMVDKIIVHAGKHWQSKTFPKDWWDQVLSAIIRKGATPILIGANTDEIGRAHV